MTDTPTGGGKFPQGSSEPVRIPVPPEITQGEPFVKWLGSDDVVLGAIIVCSKSWQAVHFDTFAPRLQKHLRREFEPEISTPTPPEAGAASTQEDTSKAQDSG